MDLTIPLGKLSSLYAPLASASPAPGLSGEAERSDVGDIKRMLYGMRVNISTLRRQKYRDDRGEAKNNGDGRTCGRD